MPDNKKVIKECSLFECPRFDCNDYPECELCEYYKNVSEL